MSHLRLVWDARRSTPAAPLSPPLRVLSRQIEHAVRLVGANAVADMLAHSAAGLHAHPAPPEQSSPVLHLPAT